MTVTKTSKIANADLVIFDRAQFADLIHDKTNKVMSVKHAKKGLEFLLGSISENVNNGMGALIGVGTLSLVNKAARPGRNPKTGEPYPINARKAATLITTKETPRYSQSMMMESLEEMLFCNKIGADRRNVSSSTKPFRVKCKTHARLIVETFISVIKGVGPNYGVAFRGFGAFNPHITKARYVRNPKTGERTWKGEGHVVKFKAYKEFIHEG